MMGGAATPSGPPPTALPFPTDLAQVPTEFAALKHWVAWEWAWRQNTRGEWAWTKPPINPRTGGHASSSVPSTWATFPQAVACARKRELPGIGIELTEDMGIVGIDLDKCRDPATGVIEEWALAIVRRLDTFTQVSPTGTGLRAFVKGTLPGPRRRTGHVEMYSKERYLTLTAERVPGTPGQIQARQAALEAWYAEVFPPEPPRASGGVWPGGASSPRPVPLEDDDLLDTMFLSPHGGAIRDLWDGDLRSYDDNHSSADQALCNHLAFWTSGDASRIDSLFRRSGLYRAKWDERRGTGTYGSRTIAKAIADCPEGYSGPSSTYEREEIPQAEASPLPAAAGPKPSPNGKVPHHLSLISARDLMAKTFPPPRYAVPGVLPEGLSILAGRPKIGKSFLSLGLCLAVAGGTPALGVVEVEQGDVLYLALEDGERRLQRRIGDLMNDQLVPERLTFTTTWRSLDKGGLDDLEMWIAGHPDARLIGIDTFKRIRPRERANAGVYGQDYEAVAPVADLAHRYSISIFLVMHTRKQEAEDPIDLISGSLGLSGAADGALVMQRQRGGQDALLSVIDRDAEDNELALRWDIGTGGWVLLGNAAEYKRSAQRDQVVDALHDLGPCTPKEVAAHLDKPQGTIRRLLWGLVQDRQVSNAGGTYLPLVPRTPIDKANGANTPNGANGANGANGDAG